MGELVDTRDDLAGDGCQGANNGDGTSHRVVLPSIQQSPATPSIDLVWC